MFSSSPRYGGGSGLGARPLLRRLLSALSAFLTSPPAAFILRHSSLAFASRSSLSRISTASSRAALSRFRASLRSDHASSHRRFASARATRPRHSDLNLRRRRVSSSGSLDARLDRGGVLRVRDEGSAVVVLALARRVAAPVALDGRGGGGLRGAFDPSPRLFGFFSRAPRGGDSLRLVARLLRLGGGGRRLETTRAVVLLPRRHGEEVAHDPHELRLGQPVEAGFGHAREEFDLRANLVQRAEGLGARAGVVVAARASGDARARGDARAHGVRRPPPSAGRRARMWASCRSPVRRKTDASKFFHFFHQFPDHWIHFFQVPENFGRHVTGCYLGVTFE